ncbi:MAG: hypothetical protein COB15_13805 [Flavobacteriales bacterium]|nr:MAG: hypothetical protein COB15_13805 [Flavobacteriales bacterium]
MKFLLTVLLSLFILGAKAQSSLNMNLLYQWKDTTLIKSVIGSTYNEVWGHEQNGREYAIIGSTVGTHIFDVTDVNNVDSVAFIPGKLQSTQVVHRDYDTYQNYLYMVCDEGPSSLQIADLSYLPDSVPLVYDESTVINTSHNIFIDTAAGYLYTCGGATTAWVNYLSVYSLSADPLNPQLVINCNIDVPFWSSTIGYVHDIYVKNDTGYCNAGPAGLFVVDFSDMNNVQSIGSLTSYAQQGYNHSGWLHSSGNYYAFADETAGKDVKIVDVTNFSNITLIDTIGSNVDQNNSMPHNVIFKGDLLYVSFYEDGLYVFNTSDPNNIFVEGYYDTSLMPYHLAGGNWGVYPFLPSGKILASDEQEGLLVFETFFSIGVEKYDQEKNIELIVYPNPSTGFVNIDLNKVESPESYTVVDVKGSVLETGMLTREQLRIDMNKFDQGVYLIYINQTNGNRISKKIIIN